MPVCGLPSDVPPPVVERGLAHTPGNLRLRVALPVVPAQSQCPERPSLAGGEFEGTYFFAMQVATPV